MRPLIGISSYGRAGSRLSFSVPCEYVDAIRASGGIPVILPPMDGEVPETFAAIHGLVLSGGGDIDAAEYGAVPHETNYDVSPERDRFELLLARTALGREGLPVLGICRGMQVLNVAVGGTLVQHIPDAFGSDVLHRHPERKPIPHGVRIDDESLLANTLSRTDCTVQSWHHQAVDRLGDGMRPVAWSPDGVIEAVETTERRFALGVQWHPEIDVTRCEAARRLFATFVLRCTRS